jgi:hypothetical protein
MPIVNEHVEQWSNRRCLLRAVERTRLETIKALVEREQKQQKEAHEQEIKEARWNAASATAITQRLAQEIEDAGIALMKLIKHHAGVEEMLTEAVELQKREHTGVQNEAKEAIVKLMERHAEAEKRESEVNSKLQALLAQEDEPKGRA